MSSMSSKKRKSAVLPLVIAIAVIIGSFAAMAKNDSADSELTTADSLTTSHYYSDTTERTGNRDDFRKLIEGTSRSTARRTTTAYKVKYVPKTVTITETTRQETTTAKQTVENQLARPTCAWYNTLSNAEKAVYNTACYNIEHGNYQVSFYYNGNDGYELVDKMFLSVFHDHPEYFWLKYRYDKKQEAENGNTKYTITFKTCDFWDEISDRQKCIDDFNRCVNGIANHAMQKQTDYDKVKFVHDYLVMYSVYDNEAADYCEDENPDAKYDYAYTAYGAIVNGKCVCAGYSKAFQVITQRMGFECLYINGPVENRGAHAWNCIKIGGKYYNVDVTWDDRNDSGCDNAISYMYFCIPDSEFYSDRKPYDNVVVYKCTSSDLIYYRRNNCFVSVYTPESIERVLAKQKNSQCVGIEFMNPTQADIAYKELRNNKKIWSISALMENAYYTGSCSFIYVKDRTTLEIIVG